VLNVFVVIGGTAALVVAVVIYFPQMESGIILPNFKCIKITKENTVGCCSIEIGVQ
jgi:hypothetical protein